MDSGGPSEQTAKNGELFELKHRLQPCKTKHLTVSEQRDERLREDRDRGIDEIERGRQAEGLLERRVRKEERGRQRRPERDTGRIV